MKRLFAILALVGAFGFTSPAWSDETVAPTEAATEVAAAAPAAEAAPAAPTITVNKGDNAWLMVSAAFVILMSIPGLALFYGGLVRTKNMLSVLAQVFAVFCQHGVCSVGW